MNSTIDHRAAAANRTSDTLAILDTLARLAQAQDDSDTDGYRACFMETVLIDQQLIAGWQPKWISSTEWAKIALAPLKEFEVTQHRLFNPVVNFDGDVATCVVDVHAIHILEVDGITKEWVVGGRYTLKLERVDTRWLISERVLQVRFQQGDLSLVGRVLDRAQRSL